VSISKTKNGKFILAAMIVYQIRIFQTQSALRSRFSSQKAVSHEIQMPVSSSTSRNLSNHCDLLQNGKCGKITVSDTKTDLRVCIRIPTDDQKVVPCHRSIVPRRRTSFSRSKY
jgi:hypothetical protein